MAIYLGGNSISEIYLGSQKIKEVYLGSQLVYSAGETFPAGTIKLQAEGGSITVTNRLGYSVQYSETLNGTKTTLGAGDSTPATLGKVYIHGINYYYGAAGTPGLDVYGTNVSVSGLLRNNNASYYISYLFSSLPNIVDASGLVLAGNDNNLLLAGSAYMGFFQNCTGLKKPAQITATNTTTSCYRDMYYGCTALQELPALPATTLEMYCYRQMFNGCSNIQFVGEGTAGCKEYRIPPTGTGTTGVSSTNNMFNGCSNASIWGATTPSVNTTYYYKAIQ